MTNNKQQTYTIEQIATYLKKDDLEWLGFNWFRLRVGLLILEGQN